MKLGSLKAGPRRPAGGGEPRSRLVRGRRPYRADAAGGARRLGADRAAARAARHRPRPWRHPPRPLPRARRPTAPLPRAYQWADGSAYVNHVALVRQARGAEMPESFWTDPLMYQGGSDEMLAPRDPIPLADEAWGCDLEAEIVVVTGDVPRGVIARGGARPHQAGRAGQRRLAAQPDPGRARQGLRLPPVQARLGAVAGASSRPTSSASAWRGRQAPRRAQGRSQRRSRSAAPMPART